MRNLTLFLMLVVLIYGCSTTDTKQSDNLQFSNDMLKMLIYDIEKQYKELYPEFYKEIIKYNKYDSVKKETEIAIEEIKNGSYENYKDILFFFRKNNISNDSLIKNEIDSLLDMRNIKLINDEILINKLLLISYRYHKYYLDFERKSFICFKSVKPLIIPKKNPINLT